MNIIGDTMPTGACGINCDVCKLRLLGTCSSCGSGKSGQATMKLEAQRRTFGGTCSILECASMNNLEYCMRDCDLFPCENFRLGPYPFSQGFLNMQERRRNEPALALTPNSVPIQIPPEYWDKLKKRDVSMLCNLIFGEPHPSGGLIFQSFQDKVWIDIKNKMLKRFQNNQWEEINDLLFELVTLVYLNNVNSLYPMGKDIVGTKDLREGYFFQGSHELKVDALLDRYGNDPESFKIAAERLGGKSSDMADFAYMLLPFPRIPVYFLLWKGDKEFKPRMSILFDRSIEEYFEADAIWGIANMVSGRLMRAY